ncbi:MAG: sugar phosphate isomerase/epimerase [Pirellulaceae bacterium]|nr:sugar phosphate isomerase/epimerase [Pirellulaceae bacterium]
MQYLKIGIALASLRQPFKKALHTAAQLGAQGVEIDARSQEFAAELSQTAVRHIRKLLDDLNLRVCAVAFPTRRGYGEMADLDRRVAATRRALKLAHQLAAPVVVNQVGRVPEDPADPVWGRLVETLADVGRYGQHVGVWLAAQTGAEPGARLRRLLDAISSGGVAADLHPGQLIINGFSAREAATELGPHVRHVHVSDAVRDPSRGQGVAVSLGRGSADLPELLSVLANHEYQGFFTGECPGSDDPISELTHAIQYLRSLG